MMKVECFGCGEDCSHAYATWRGDPYHFGCIPMRRARRGTESGEPKPIPPSDDAAPASVTTENKEPS